ncbi:MAG TPA: DUF4157 domain-containing protein [Kofleriaceae bacterium]|nr:DUF4157 domain-containing protein [Kofleriaceae bacterium]
MSFHSSISRNQAGSGGGRGHEDGGPSIGRRTLVEQTYGSGPASSARGPVQQVAVAAGALPAKQDPAAVHQAADHGTSGAAGPLPHLDLIQGSFGRHDVSGIKAHTDTAAATGAKAMGAEAFASGDHVAFGGAPSLFTAAHEAAHVVQQRGGVQLRGGVGEAGDPYEQHANEVASRVVQGKSAEALLDQHAPGGKGAGGSPARGPVQMVRVQRSTTGELIETTELDTQELVALAVEFFNLHNMDQLALIQEAHYEQLMALGYNISNESLEMLSAPVSTGKTKGAQDKGAQDKGAQDKGAQGSSKGSGGFKKVPIKQGLIHGTYDEETNTIDLHVEAKGGGGGLAARDMLQVAEQCYQLMTARERTGGPQGRFMLHPTGAAIVKIMVELLAGALGSRLDKWKAALLQTKRKKFGGPGGSKNPDKLEPGVLPEHFAFLDSLRGDDPGVSIVPRMRAKYNTEDNVNQNMLEKSPEGNERYETYKAVLQSSEDDEPVGPGLDVTLTSDLLPAVIETLRSRA